MGGWRHEKCSRSTSIKRHWIKCSVSQILCSQRYPEKKFRWEELLCSGKLSSNWQRGRYSHTRGRGINQSYFTIGTTVTYLRRLVFQIVELIHFSRRFSKDKEIAAKKNCTMSSWDDTRNQVLSYLRAQPRLRHKVSIEKGWKNSPICLKESL